MPLLLVRNDITKMDMDALVTSADEHLENELKPGQAKISRGGEDFARTLLFGLITPCTCVYLKYIF